MLKHDDAGFLVGDPIELSRAIDIWRDIQDDVAAIRKAISSQKPRQSDQARQAVSARQSRDRSRASVPASRPSGSTYASTDGRGKVVPLGRPKTEAATPSRPVGTKKAELVVPRLVTSRDATKIPAKRDASGRFVGGSTANAGDRSKEADNRGSSLRDMMLMDGLAGRIGDAVSSASGGMEEADPTFRAFNEVAQPLAQGYSALAGLVPGGGRDEGWFRRIFRELSSFRKEETSFSKATNRTLRKIEEKEGGEPGSGGGFLGGVFGGGGLAAAGMAALKRVPILGALIAGGSNLLDIFSSETDDSLTREEKDRKTGKGVGGLAGTLGGMWAGAKMGAMVGALGGPIGAAIGGVVGGAAGMFFGDKAGKVVGETVGGWVAELRSADIPGAISAKWNEIADGLGSKWEELTDGLKSKWESFLADAKSIWDGISKSAESAFNWVMEKGDQANSYIKDVTGVDVKETARSAVETTKNVANTAIESVKSAGKTANEYILDKTGVDVAGAATSTAQYVRSGVQSGVQSVKDGAAWASDKASDARSWISDKVSGAFGSTDEKLPKRFRQKHSFGGISGGAGLAKYGTYTDEEAQKIRELKSSGANTSANLPGGMPTEIQQKIRDRAAANGLDPEMMLSIAAMESGGNPNAISSTGATGIYQFTGGTATGVGIKDRFDVDQNIEGGMKLTRQNAAMLEKRGLPITPENLYMAHQLGPTAAAEVISGAQSGKAVSELSEGTRSGMGLNYGSRSTTAAEYLAKNAKALDARYQSVVAVNSPAGKKAETQLALAQNSQPSNQGQAGAGNQGTRYAARQYRGGATIVPIVSEKEAELGPPSQTASSGPDIEDYYANGLNRSPGGAAQSPAAQPVLFASAPAHTVSTPAVSSPSMPTPPAVADAPRVATQLGSGKSEPTKVSIPPPDAGQDVRDRQIAHIVTGGLSS